ncbi:class I SAM-dependent methyltransferase [Catalinimonas sp. 4WD22]|uniref:class I SAM-dependent methyltransferase n=1 Tax=Catalinimonas locisalis TaxID=3133978 RepID=UPI00310195D7
MANYQDYNFNETYVPHHHSYLLNPIINLLNKNNNKYILDLGCGSGFYANELIKRGYNVFGTDASETGIALAKAKHPNRFFLQNLEEDELPPEIRDITFDTIISTEVIEHLYNPQEFLMFCRKILAKNKNGTLLISTPYNGYLKNIALSVTNKWDHHLNPLWLGGHIKYWSKKTLEIGLEEAGFKINKFVGCGRLPYLWKSMLFKADIDK